MYQVEEEEGKEKEKALFTNWTRSSSFNSFHLQNHPLRGFRSYPCIFKLVKVQLFQVYHAT